MIVAKWGQKLVGKKNCAAAVSHMAGRRPGHLLTTLYSSSVVCLVLLYIVECDIIFYWIISDPTNVLSKF